jgi:hypothetical protein
MKTYIARVHVNAWEKDPDGDNLLNAYFIEAEDLNSAIEKAHQKGFDFFVEMQDHKPTETFIDGIKEFEGEKTEEAIEVYLNEYFNSSEVFEAISTKSWS